MTGVPPSIGDLAQSRNTQIASRGDFGDELPRIERGWLGT